MAADCRRVTPHSTPFATVEALRRTARDQLAEGRRSAARRTLLDALILEPDNAGARRDLVELMRRPPAAAPPGPPVGLLAVIAVLCAVLAGAALLADLDVTAVLLAAAGFFTGSLIARRRREVA